MVSDVTISTALDQQSKTAAAQTKLAEDFSQFLQLLTVQLQNQDPLDPMDTSEMTNQIVAFTGVEQQINTNQKLDNLVALGIGNSTAAALGYVGLDASYISSEFHHDGSASSIKYAMNGNAIEATIRIIDEDGKTIYEEAASTAAGRHDFIWDGTTKYGDTAEAGTYKVVIDALDSEGNGVSVTTVVQGRVSGIETQNGQLFAIIGERAVAIGNILNAKEPSSTQVSSGDDTPVVDSGDDGDDTPTIDNGDDGNDRDDGDDTSVSADNGTTTVDSTLEVASHPEQGNDTI